MTTDMAPITQLMLTVQFAPPLSSLGPLEIANCFNQFRDQFPNFEQIGRAGPMQPDPGVIEIPMPFGVARTKFTTADGSRTIMFQEDRFSYGWDRTAALVEPSGYPGFDRIMADALVAWEGLRRTLSGSLSIPLAGEVAYVDAFAANDASGAPIRLSSMFNLVNPSYLGSITGYGLTWNEPLDGMVGFLQMQINGPALSPGGPIAQFNTTGRFRMQGDWAHIADEFSKVHQVVGEAFKTLVNPALGPN